jgi:hypothetical protein
MIFRALFELQALPLGSPAQNRVDWVRAQRPSVPLARV